MNRMREYLHRELREADRRVSVADIIRDCYRRAFLDASCQAAESRAAGFLEERLRTIAGLSGLAEPGSGYRS